MGAERVERARKRAEEREDVAPDVTTEALCVAATHGVPVLEELVQEVRDADELLEDSSLEEELLDAISGALPGPLGWLPVGWLVGKIADAATDVLADAVLDRLVQDLREWHTDNCGSMGEPPEEG